MRLNRIGESKKGFSLVELIIVMAIMVVLVAVIAPQFVKYVQKARNTVVQDAANSAMQMVKSEYALGTLKFTSDEVDEATIMVQGHNGHLELVLTGLEYDGKTGTEANTAFEDACGVDRGAQTKSSVKYQITIKRADQSISPSIETAIDVDMSRVDGQG
ncbi:MAG: prepilin-type N-terminal cleavage/methylation domain-containing protein [Clostridia bacterium]|nr:prepilin-type N-terminal cleavage/methylation domain-containing protein [Clostridia bacterium]